MFDTKAKREHVREQIQTLADRAMKQRMSMVTLKQDPLNGHNLMEHISIVSANTDALLTTMQTLLTELLQEAERNDWAAK